MRVASPREGRIGRSAGAVTPVARGPRVHDQCPRASVLQVDHHTVKMHTRFLKDRKDNDFSKWHEAWMQADHDHDGKILVQEAARVFKVLRRGARARLRG